MNPTCPYCRTEIGSTEGDRLDCPGCGTPHHADCFHENGGCTVFGCSSAPVDEPKVSVSGTDLAGNVYRREVPAAPGIVLGAGMVCLPNLTRETGNQPPPPASPPPPPPPLMLGTAAPPPPLPPGRSASASASTPLADYYYGDQRKNRVVFVLLGIFLGVFGVHNFYAGYVRKGVFQLCLTVMTCFVGAIVSWVWALVEICTINKDMDGVQFT